MPNKTMPNKTLLDKTLPDKTMPTKTMPDDSLALERQVCFALAVANRSVLAVYRPLLEPMGLTHPQYLVMLALWGETPMTVKDLASALQLDPATLSPLLKRLEAAALVTRTRNEADERQLRIELTPAGKRLRSRAEQIPAQVVEKLDVTIAELETLHQVLTRINKAAVASGLKRDDWT